MGAVDSGVNFWKTILYLKRDVEAIQYLLMQLCIRLIPLLIKGVNSVAARTAPLIRIE